ncbi:hypothetical protein SLEP1_g32492 [Rubroshorea leprosula]|uniref:Uncharacterized protein n=1 Tax=Rubroshorea leprosula TaxID=152421 RepID=A0AAV5KDM8_9ROSI|nr:hypothetical protein SLEP1_g32492 [Rubroshorea leprosula]
MDPTVGIEPCSKLDQWGRGRASLSWLLHKHGKINHIAKNGASVGLNPSPN